MKEQVGFTVTDAEFKVEKYKGKPPRRDKLSMAVKRVLPIREKLPFEVVTGGDNRRTVVSHPEKVKYKEFLAQRYPKLGRIINGSS